MKPSVDAAFLPLESPPTAPKYTLVLLGVGGLTSLAQEFPLLMGAGSPLGDWADPAVLAKPLYCGVAQVQTCSGCLPEHLLACR